MGAMTRPLDDIIGLMESAAKKILVEEYDHNVDESFGMSELVATVGSVTATFVDELMMTRAYTEDSGTTVQITIYSVEDAYLVSLDDPDEIGEDTTSEH